MSTVSFQEAWQGYQDAVLELYQAPRAAASESDRSPGEVYAEKLEESGDKLTGFAAEVRESLQPAMQSEDLDQRELAGLKLLAAAALDLSMADDLLAMEKKDAGQEIDRSANSLLLTGEELLQVLDAPLEAGLSGLAEVDRGVPPEDPALARRRLVEKVTEFLRDIPDQAADLSQKAVVGVANIGIGPGQAVASLAVQELGILIPEGLSRIGKKAAALAVEAIQKLRAALGEEQEQEIRKQAAEWFAQIEQDRDAVASLFDQLYSLESLGQEVQVSIAAAPDSLPAEAFNSATQKLEDLLGRYTKTKKTLEKVMSVLSLVKVTLLPAIPWGPVVLYASYLGMGGYAIFNGADYLDSARFERAKWLDRVQGLRSVVAGALIPAPEATPPAEAGQGTGAAEGVG